MSSWSSWFTGLPVFDFAVPSSIQRRFFSFLLRRTLGHFLKPGQLDLHQIDSQLGSGTVQVKDLELDSQAINQLLVGLPVTLYDGFISGVTARIPFPNPLSSTVGCRVQSLNLTFQLTPEQPISSSTSFHNGANLADSVVSVAETFIHDELTPREEATLRQTLRPSAGLLSLEDESDNLPGGFNPFGYNFHVEEPRKEPHSDDDPAGVSVFATLIERLLAKFEFSAADTKITIVYPGEASFTLSVSEIVYHTDTGPSKEVNSAMSEGNNRSGQVRTVSISGLKVTSRDLRVTATSPTVTSTLSPVSFTTSQRSSPLQCNPLVDQLSRNSSSSSLDEDIQLMMSRSIAILPPSSPSSLSASSSMYQSAVSTDHVRRTQMDIASAVLSATQVAGSVADSIDNELARPGPRLSIPCHDPMEDVLLSFGKQPIVFSLQTPSRLTQPSGQGVRTSGGPTNLNDFVGDQPEQETLQMSITVGTLACAFRSRHLRVLLDIADACISKLPTTSPVSRKEASELPCGIFYLEAKLVVRGVVVIALAESSTGEQSLEAFFERPLAPPRLPCTYSRLFLDTISASFRPSMLFPDPSVTNTVRTSSIPVERSASATMFISDVSLFIFHGVSSVDDLHTASPILITDHYLPTLHTSQVSRPSLASERPMDIKLPVFEIIDWTQAKFKGGSAKLSTWRLRNRTMSRKVDKSHTPSQGSSGLSSPPNPFISSPLSETEDKLSVYPAIEVSGWLVSPRPSKESSRTVDIKVVPLHLFLDLGTVFNENIFMCFVEDVASASFFKPRKVEDIAENESFHQHGSGQLETHQISFHARERDEERKRLEALVLEDLDLGVDSQRPGTSKLRSSQQPPALLKKNETVPIDSSCSLRLTCPMIRVEVRCPPPPPRLLRSGCMLFDLRGLAIIFSDDPPSAKPSLRFSEEVKPAPLCLSQEVTFLTVCMQQILAAYSLVGDNLAHSILILGSLPTKEIGPDMSTLLDPETIPDPLPLSIELRRPKHMSKLSMSVNIPLVNLRMGKDTFDGLQCWADDVAQLFERKFTASDGTTETPLSRNPSLIGSRYFTQSRRSGIHSMDEFAEEKPEREQASATVVKISITEALLRFILSRNDDSQHTRPLDISALDVGTQLEDGMVTAKIMDLCISDTSTGGDYIHILRSPACSLSSAPRPLVRCTITSFAVPETTAKGTRISLSLCDFTAYPTLDGNLASDLSTFAKAPPGVFESVVPSECTRLTVSIVDASVHMRVLGHPGAVAVYFEEAEFSTELAGNSSEAASKLSVSLSHLFLVDSIQDAFESTGTAQSPLGRGVDFWKNSGYALIAEISHFQLAFQADSAIVPPNICVLVERFGLRIHLCADTISALTGLITNMTNTPKEDTALRASRATLQTPNTVISAREHYMTASFDEHAFKVIPEVGSTADMIFDDLPANQDYLDASFGTAAGLRELRDDDLEDFDLEEMTSNTLVMGQPGIISNVGGETIRILKSLSFTEHHFDTISPDATQDPDSDTTLRIRIRNSDVVLFLHDGFDWPRTRKVVEKEIKEMRKRLARIRQLVSTGQTQEPINEPTSTTLFNSFHIGLERDLESMDPDALIAAIDDELDDPAETGTESSWQSLPPASPGRPRTASTRLHGKRLTRSKGPSIEIRLEGLSAEIDNYRPGETLVSRTLILVRDLEILDHIKTSTWKKFLTDMRSDSRGNARETGSNMARVELLSVRPSLSHPAEEARLRAKILPLRLYVDQDALDFFKKFFAFQDPDNPPIPDDGGRKEGIYFQHAEVFPVDIKLDYKPRRVDYRALRDGRTIELMNFFHFDGAEMTLRHLTLHGITGWPRFFDTLNDLWTPDVKATQLVDVISGVAPIRSVVNVGSGVADLVLLPIAQYKKDGRVVRGLQKGTKAFVQSTAMEAIKLGARLATGTQVILEQAENVLGGQFKGSVTTEALQIPYEDEFTEGSDEDLISRYAAQPTGLKEGVQSAYRSLQRNLHSAAQTILAVPMEVYERSGNEGAVRAVVRAVPIAVLKPMIGASEAVSKTLMGLHNTLDPNIRLENEAKYKHR